MSEKVKCYSGNYDGVSAGFVVAKNQKQAAEIAYTTLYDFRRFWGQVDWPKDWTPLPYVLYLKKYNEHGTKFEPVKP